MSLLKSFEFIPGIKWFESEMHNSLFQHSVFGAIVFLIVSNTGVYKLVKDTIFQCCGVKLDGNTLQLVHAVVFMVIMYFGSMYLFAPLLGEGYPKPEGLTQPPIVRSEGLGQDCENCRTQERAKTDAAGARGVNHLLSLLASDDYQSLSQRCSVTCAAAEENAIEADAPTPAPP